MPTAEKIWLIIFQWNDNQHRKSICESLCLYSDVAKDVANEKQ